MVARMLPIVVWSGDVGEILKDDALSLHRGESLEDFAIFFGHGEDGISVVLLEECC